MPIIVSLLNANETLQAASAERDDVIVSSENRQRTCLDLTSPDLTYNPRRLTCEFFCEVVQPCFPSVADGRCPAEPLVY